MLNTFRRAEIWFCGDIKNCLNAECLRCRIAGVFVDRRGNSSRFPTESRARAERNSLRETSGKHTGGSNFEQTRSDTLAPLKLISSMFPPSDQLL